MYLDRVNLKKILCPLCYLVLCEMTLWVMAIPRYDSLAFPLILSCPYYPYDIPAPLPFLLKLIWNQRSLTGKGRNTLYLLNRHLFIEQNSDWMYSTPVECARRRKGYRNKNTRKQEDIDYTYSRTLYQCNYPHFGQCFPSVLILVLANGFEVTLNFFLSFKHPLNSLAYPVCSSFKTHAESNPLSHFTAISWSRTFSCLSFLCTLLASFPQVTLSHWGLGYQQLQGNSQK